jgi:hypothetical protein
MERNGEKGLPPPHANRDEQGSKANRTVDRDAKNVPPEAEDVEPGPAERPDLDWSEHED